MSAVAIITARGGSKRIPRKNVKPFLGKPILAYSIEAALHAGCFDEVMVSTDDEEIAGIAKQYGATVPFFRSKETSDDFATTADVLKEVIFRYREMGKEYTHLCCIYPTAPFLDGEEIRTAMDTLVKEGVDTVLPVVRFSFPPQRAVVMKDGYLVPKWPENMNARSQDLEPFFHDCGQFYCLRTESFLAQNKIVMEKTMPFVQEEMKVQDIDTPEDWEIAEMKYRIMYGDRVQ